MAYSDGQSVKNLAASGTKILYAVWEQNKYTVKFDPNGGKGGTSTMVIYDAVPGNLGGGYAPSRLGYVFQGYFTAASGGNMFYDSDMSWVGNSGGKWNMASDTKLYARWTPLTYKVDLYNQGIFEQTLEVTYGTLNLPGPIESIPNHTFMGWNAYDNQDWSMFSANTTLNVGLTEKPGETVFLYAAWKENPKYTVSLDANGGSGVPGASQVYQGNDYTIPTTVPTREQFTFLGWSEDSRAAQPDYTAGDAISNVQSGKVLYAIWQQNPKLTYDANGGAFGVYVPDEYPTKNTDHTLVSARPAMEGFDFAGWTEGSGGTVYPAGGLFPMPATDTTLYAEWTPKQYQVRVTAPGEYTVDGIDPGGYPKGDTVTFTVSGGDDYTAYANGVPVIDGSFTITADTELHIMKNGTNQFLVTYMPNGGAGGPADATIYTAGTTVTVQFDVQPSRSGYTFAGWAEAADPATPVYTAGGTTQFSMPSGGMILYAVWEPIDYTVTYDANASGAAGNPGATGATYDAAFSTATSTAFTRTGYKIVGWATTQADADQGRYSFLPGGSASNLTTIEDDTVTLYAVWQPVQTKITFDANGGILGMSINYIFITYGQGLTDNLNPPDRPGYTLDGWYGNVGSDTHLPFFDGAMRPQIDNWTYEVSDVTIQAEWTPIKYNVRLMQGETVVATANSLSYDMGWTIPLGSSLSKLTIPNTHYLAGWAAVKDSTFVNYSDGYEFTSGLTTRANDTVMLYAVIREKPKYGVRYDANGGSGVPVDAATYLLGDSVTAKFDTIPQRVGYTFLGWSARSDATSATYVDADGQRQFTMGDDAVTLYAVWKQNDYFVLYDANGGDGTVPQSALTFGQAGGLAGGNTLSLAGHTLAGWSTSANGAVVYGLGATVWNLSDQANGQVTLYAVWMPNTYTVAFKNGANTTALTQVRFGAAYGVLPGGPEKPGHDFAGWYTAETGGVRIEGTEIYNTAGDSTLYACWTAAQYTVSFDGNGGTVSPATKNVTYGEAFGTLPVPKRDNFSFDGWFTQKTGGEVVTAASVVTITGSAVLYARWSKEGALSVTVNAPVGCEVTGLSELYDSGETVIFFVTAKPGYDVSGITVTANTVTVAPAANGAYSFVISQDTVIFVTGVAEQVYGVSYDHNGGTGDVPPAQTGYKPGDAVTVGFSPQPTRAGYVFRGWSRTADAALPEFTQNGGTSFPMPTQPVTLYAVWDLERYSFTAASTADYAVSGIAFDQAADEDGKYPYGTKASFRVSSDSGTVQAVYANGEIISANIDGVYMVTIVADTVILASTASGAQVYKVALHTNGGIISSGLVNSYVGGVGAVLPDSTQIFKLGHAFGGWFIDAGLSGSPVAAIAAADTGDKTFYAKWTAETYTVTLPSDAHNCTVEAVSGSTSPVPYGGSYSFTVTVDLGYDGKGLRVTAGGVLLAPETSAGRVYTFTIQNIQKNTVVSVSGLTGSIHTVTYMADDKQYSTAMVNHSGTLIEPVAPSKEGHTFLGWFDGGTRWAFGVSGTQVMADTTLTAGWSLNRHTVTVADNGVAQITVDGAQPYTYGSEVTFHVTPESSYVPSEVLVYVNGTLVGNAGQTDHAFTITSDTVIAAASSNAARYPVSLDVSGGGTVNAGQIFEYIEGVGALLPIHVTRPGYIFKGWQEVTSTRGGGSSATMIPPNAKGEKKFVPIWEPQQFVLSALTSTLGVLAITSPSADSKYSIGTTVSFTLALTPGYAIDTVLVMANGNPLRGTPNGAVYDFTYTVTQDTTLYLASASSGSIVYTATLTGYSGGYDGQGHTLTVSVIPNNLNGVSYAWYKDGTPLPEAKAATYTVSQVSDSGVYTCTVSGTDPTTGVRNVYSNPVMVSITHAPLSIYAQWGITYGNAYGNTPKIVCTGLRGNDTKDVISGIAGLTTSCDYRQYDPAGTYPITLSGVNRLTAANYTVTEGTSALTVKPRSVSLTWSGTKLAHTGAAQSVTATVTNAVNRDAVNVISYTGNTQTNVGLYTARATALDNSNYTLAGGTVIEHNWGIGNVVVPPDPDAGDTPGNTDPDPERPDNPGGGVGGGGGGGPAADTGGTVIVLPPDFGSISYMPMEPKPGEQVTLTPAPGPGGLLERLTVTDADGKNIPLTDNGDGTYSFVMPEAGDATVHSSYRCSRGAHCPCAAYDDLDNTRWYHDAVDFMLRRGLMKGVSTQRFAPFAPASRATIVTILYRLEGSPAAEKSSFFDVPEGAWYAGAVAWANDCRIVEGYNDGRFAPNDLITREQLAAILYRYAQYKSYDVTARADLNKFSDVQQISSYAASAIQWANAVGLMNGRSNRTLDPAGEASRTEIAAMLMRFMQNVVVNQ